MIRAAAERGTASEPHRADDLVAPILRAAETSLVLDPDKGRQTNLTSVGSGSCVRSSAAEAPDQS